MRIPMLTLLLLLGSAPAQAALVENLTLDMNGGAGLTGVNSTAVLSSGTTYQITVSGTFEIGCISNGPCPTDAEYYFPAPNNVPDQPYTRTGFDSPAGLDVGVRINDVKIDWGPFNPLRVYSILFVGLDDTIKINYQDSNYADNVGALAISIETLDAVVPIPAALPLFLSGLAVIGLLRRRPATV